METPLTAEQINRPQMGQVALAPKPSVPLGREQDSSFSLKSSREKLIEAVKNAPKIPDVWKAVLLAEIALIDPKHELLRLDFVRHAHGAGSNGCWTVKEL